MAKRATVLVLKIGSFSAMGQLSALHQKNCMQANKTTWAILSGFTNSKKKKLGSLGKTFPGKKNKMLHPKVMLNGMKYRFMEC